LLVGAHQGGRLLDVPQDLDAAVGLGAAPVGDERAQHVVPEPGLALEDRGHGVDVLGAAHDHGPLAERSATPCAVQQPAQHVAVGHQQQGADHEGQHEEPTGELELRQVAPDAEQGGRDQAGVDHALVLVGAGAEDALVVAAAQCDEQDPDEDQRDRHERDRLTEGRAADGRLRQARRGAGLEEVRAGAAQRRERDGGRDHHEVEEQRGDGQRAQRVALDA